METTKQTTQEYFKTLLILHLALSMGPVFFGLITTFLILGGVISNDATDLNTIFLYLIPIITISGLLSSIWVYKMKLRGLKEEKDFKTKMTNYRSALIIRYALLEGAAFFAILAVILTCDLLFLAFAGLMIILLILWRPTKKLVISDLKLNMLEKAFIEDPESIIADITSTDQY